MKKVIFVFFVLFSYIYLTAGKEEYEYTPFSVTISDELKTLFYDKKRPGTGKDEWEYAFDEINKSLRESFNAVWKTFESKKGDIKDTIIQEAIEKLRIKIKEKKKFIGINFELDDAYEIYYKDNFLVKVGDTVVDSKLTYDTMIKNKDVGGEVVNNDSDLATIGIFNGFENFQVLNMKYLDKAKGCTYEGYKDYSRIFKEPLKDILPTSWKWTPSKTYSFQSALFHELVHVALQDAEHERKGDEASVEDITLLIFPRNPVNKGDTHGANFREMTYDKALVEGDFQGIFFIAYRLLIPFLLLTLLAITTITG